MLELKSCPLCGVESLIFDGKIMECQKCDFIFYNNTAAAVAVVIKKENKILFTRRSQNPGFGKLDLAGGFIDFEETAENACKRELQEELQINIDETKLKYICSLPNIYPYRGIIYHTMDLFFEYEVKETLKLVLEKQEVSDAIWIEISSLDLEKLAFESQKRFFRKYMC